MDENTENRVDLTADVLQVRADTAKREIDMRLLPWDYPIDTLQGREMFVRGAFSGTDPASVYLYGTNHEVRLGLDQGGSPTLTRVPTGKAISITEPDDGPHVTFRVARTVAGDEQLALAADGIVTGISAEFRELPNGTEVKTIDGRRTRVHSRVRLSGATTTPTPAYGERAAVLAIRQAQENQVADTAQETPAAAPPNITNVDLSPVTAAITAQIMGLSDRFSERLNKLEEQNRSAIILPTQAAPEKAKKHSGDWMQFALRSLAGERIPEVQYRDLLDIITTENIGVVPDAVSSTIIGRIQRRRPFMETTTRLQTPASGITMIFPRLVTRPDTDVQDVEKDPIESSQTEIDTVSFNMVTIAGGGDLSLQLLKRSEPSFLEYYLQLLAESYGANCEINALGALLNDGAINHGGTLDPEDLTLGQAWSDAYDATFAAPDTIWLSSTGVAAFIDAKANTTNTPLYSNIRSDINAAGGLAGDISGLRPVHVSGLNGTGSDVIVGPRDGFGWVEDGTYTLQVDVPARAGRDVAIAGMLFFCPLYPAAFTEFDV